MRDHESVLTRWSRRKRRVLAEVASPQRSIDASVDTNGARAPVKASVEQPTVDPESLPPIETIEAGTDIRDFLSKDVPTELASAALRRAWTSDCTIRDFIGLSENSWDFNASGGIPGFGSIAASEVERLVTQLMGQPEPSEAPPLAVGSRTAQLDSCQTDCFQAGGPDPASSTPSDAALGETTVEQLARSHKQTALCEVADREGTPAPRHRAHGSALPR